MDKSQRNFTSFNVEAIFPRALDINVIRMTTMPRFLNFKRKQSQSHVVPYPKMASKDRRDRSSLTTAKLCIGNYVLGTTLGVGTFGKVKSKCLLGLFIKL